MTLYESERFDFEVPTPREAVRETGRHYFGGKEEYTLSPVMRATLASGVLAVALVFVAAGLQHIGWMAARDAVGTLAVILGPIGMWTGVAVHLILAGLGFAYATFAWVARKADKHLVPVVRRHV